MIVSQHKGRGQRRAGFTLLEVLVVVAILVILASVAVIAIPKYLEDAKESSARLQCETIAKGAESYKLKYGSYPENVQQVAPYIDNADGNTFTSGWGTPYVGSVTQDASGNEKYVVSVTTTTNPPITISNLDKKSR